MKFWAILVTSLYCAVNVFLCSFVFSVTHQAPHSATTNPCGFLSWLLHQYSLCQGCRPLLVCFPFINLSDSGEAIEQHFHCQTLA